MIQLQLSARHPLRPLALAGLLALSGCSWLAPGMQMILPSQGVTTHAPDRATPLQVDLLPITPDLLKSQQLVQAQLPSLPEALFSKPEGYRLGPGDVVNVLVYEHPEFSAVAQGVTGATSATVGFAIDPSGMLRFPLAGTIPAGGMTVNDLADELNRRLARYVQTPQATVRVIDYRSKKVFVDGDVRQPGLVPVNDVPMSITDALARAGGVLPGADQSRVLLFRKGGQFTFDIPGLMAAGQPVNQLYLQDGDVVRVPNTRDTQVYVIGEVQKPTGVPMRTTGLRLSEALGEALGVNGFTANARQIYVVRNVALDRAEVYHLDAKSPVALAIADNFRLQPRDVVYVDSTALVRFNRVLSLILPSAQTVQSVRSLTNN